MSTSMSPGTAAMDAARVAQQNFFQMSGGYERLTRGLAQIAMEQIALSRRLLEGSLEDFNLLAQARSPEAFMRAEMEVFRRRSERAMGAAQQIGEELREAWTELSGFAQSFNAAVPGVAIPGVAAPAAPQSTKPAA